MKKIFIVLNIIGLLATTSLYAEELTESQQKELEIMEQQWKEMHEKLYVLADNLDKCEEFSQKFIHPFTGNLIERRIIGIEDSKCVYSEEMPGNLNLICSYTKEVRKAVARYYRELADAELSGEKVSTRVESKTSLDGERQVKSTYVIDGKKVENPLDQAMNDGTCVSLVDN